MSNEPRLVDVAIDELEFQLNINQQLGEENQRLRAENAALRDKLSEAEDEVQRLGFAEGAMYEQMRERAEAAESALEDVRPIVEMFARGYTEEATIGFPEFIISLDDDAEFVATDAMLAQARAFLAAGQAAESEPIP